MTVRTVRIAGGRLIDPASGADARADLYLADGRIAAIGQAPAGFQAQQHIDARGLAVLPGLVDLSARVHGAGLAPLACEMQAALDRRIRCTRAPVARCSSKIVCSASVSACTGTSARPSRDA